MKLAQTEKQNQIRVKSCNGCRDERVGLEAYICFFCNLECLECLSESESYVSCNGHSFCQAVLERMKVSCHNPEKLI